MDAKWLKQYLNCFGDQTWKIFLGALCQLRYGLALAVCQGVGFDIGDDVTLEHALPDLKDKVGAWVSGDTNLKVLTEEAVFLMKELTYGIRRCASISREMKPECTSPLEGVYGRSAHCNSLWVQGGGH